MAAVANKERLRGWLKDVATVEGALSSLSAYRFGGRLSLLIAAWMERGLLPARSTMGGYASHEPTKLLGFSLGV